MKKKPLHDYDPMPFGPFRGQHMRRVPARYLLELTAEDLARHPEVAGYIKHAERVLRHEVKHEKRNQD